jgi:hypothetical protein
VHNRAKKRIYSQFFSQRIVNGNAAAERARDLFVSQVLPSSIRAGLGSGGLLSGGSLLKKRRNALAHRIWCLCSICRLSVSSDENSEPIIKRPENPLATLKQLRYGTIAPDAARHY